MNDDRSPVFRRIIAPWYDSDRTCLIMVALLLMVAGFGACGLSVALESPEWQRYAWLPGVLILLAVGVAVSMLRRLIRRYLAHTARHSL
jgi:hypothetical protein